MPTKHTEIDYITIAVPKEADDDNQSAIVSQTTDDMARICTALQWVLVKSLEKMFGDSWKQSYSDHMHRTILKEIASVSLAAALESVINGGDPDDDEPEEDPVEDPVEEDADFKKTVVDALLDDMNEANDKGDMEAKKVFMDLLKSLGTDD